LVWFGLVGWFDLLIDFGWFVWFGWFGLLVRFVGWFGLVTLDWFGWLVG
jgi:hypothetical protein